MSDPVEEPEPGPELAYLPFAVLPMYTRPNIAHRAAPVSWVWDGYLARGSVTLLTGQWKVGKSTLLAALLARLNGGGELAGRPVAPGTAVVISEEGLEMWARRMATHAIGDETAFICNPYPRKPVQSEWEQLTEGLREQNWLKKIDLVVLDTLAPLLPGNEEANARAMIDTLRPLRALAEEGAAVLLMHHPKKGAAPDGQAARGTGALPAAVDTILEYRWAGSPAKENRHRRLLNWSRHAGAPREVILRLDESEATYSVVPAVPGLATDETRRILLDLVRAAPGITCSEVIEAWPPVEGRPQPRTVQVRLTALVDAGELTRTRAATKDAAFQYRLAEPPENRPKATTVAATLPRGDATDQTLR